jgi:hypothetical protein
MVSYLVIGLCIVLLLAVIIISAKPIGMGIEARQNLNREKLNNQEDINENISKLEDNKLTTPSISEEIKKLKKLHDDGILSEEDYEKAKNKLLS